MSGLDVRSFTVGLVQENCYIVSDPEPAAGPGGLRPAVIVDPGEEPERLLEAAKALGVRLDAILLTHCHFDHIGAVAPVARATNAPVYCPEIERPVLADVMSWVPPGFGPFDSWEAEHTVAGGEHLTLAGLEIDVIFTPGHSPGHVTYAIAPASAQAAGSDASPGTSDDGPQTRPAAISLLSGDVLFQGSVGRVDLPGGDWPTLERSIGGLIRSYARETVVYPGHMGVTTLGRERDTNPFLTELRERVPRAAVAPDATAAER
jgi:hydroxyacylglutathione hydrolase